MVIPVILRIEERPRRDFVGLTFHPAIGSGAAFMIRRREPLKGTPVVWNSVGVQSVDIMNKQLNKFL